MSRGITSKSECFDRLESSAIELFSSQGFEGTSLRDIAARADVVLSTIHRYFGTKMDLFNEVWQRVWRDISLDREALMREPIAVEPDGVPTLDAVIYALVHPIVMRAAGDVHHQAPAIRLLREGNAMWLHMGVKSGCLPPVLGAERWVQALMAACPKLSRSHAVWAVSFITSAMLSSQLLDGWLNDLMPPDSRKSAAEITRMIVAFCRAGIRAIAEEASPPGEYQMMPPLARMT